MKQPPYKNPPVILNYEILQRDTLEDLEESVNNAIKEGYQPFGPPDLGRLTQAVVLYDVEDAQEHQ